MGVAVQHHVAQCIELPLFLSRERSLRIHKMYAAREDSLVFGLVLPGEYNARSNRNSDRYSVLHLTSGGASPQRFEQVYALRHKVV